jgi:hypothetical protein
MPRFIMIIHTHTYTIFSMREKKNTHSHTNHSSYIKKMASMFSTSLYNC